MTASILQQLLALYFEIIYSWQLSSCEKSLVGKKIHPYISRILQIQSSFTQINFSFSLTNTCFPCRLSKAYATLWTANRFVCSKIPDHNAFDQFWKVKFNFEYFSRHARLFSFDGPSKSLYLFKNHQHFGDHGNVRHPNSKLLKCDLIQTFDTFRNRPLRMFAAGKTSLVINWWKTDNFEDLFCWK